MSSINITFGLDVKDNLNKTVNSAVKSLSNSSLTKVLDTEYVLAAAETGAAINFGNITEGKYLIIIADAVIQAKINASVDAIPVESLFFTCASNAFSSGFITSLTLANPNSDKAVKVRVIITE
jgi:hypothetical protein